MEQRQISQLEPHPANPRGGIRHDESLRELAMSIKEQGVLQPVIVTPSNRIVAGHRRVEAAKLANLKSVPVTVKDLSEVQQLQVVLVENIQRADLNILQEGACYAILVTHGLTVSQISKAIGLPRQRIDNCLAVQQLPEDTQRLFVGNMINLSCSAVLAELPRQDQFHWANEAAKYKWSGSALQKAIEREGKSKPKPRPADTVKIIEQSITRLQHVDEGLDNLKFREVQSLIRQAIRLLAAAKAARAA